MSVQTKSVIKTYFETGDFPTQVQFGDFIDSVAWLTSALTAGQVVYTDASGNMVSTAAFAFDGANVTVPSLKNSALTATRVPYSGASGLQQDSANLTFDGTKLSVGGLKNAALTAGRIPYSTTNGEQTDAAGFLFDGTKLTVGGFKDSALTTGRVPYITTAGELTDTALYTFDGTILSAPKLNGGSGSSVGGTNSGALAGLLNNASADRSAVIAGTLNTASGINATVLAGASNTASGLNSSVLSGSSTTVSGPYSSSVGRSNTVSGSDSLAIGRANTASGTQSLATGNGSVSDKYSQKAHAAGFLVAVGDAQSSEYVLSAATTDATATTLKSNAVAGIAVASGQTVTVTALIVGRRDNGDSASWSVSFGIKNIAGTTTLVGGGGSLNATLIAADAGCAATWGQAARVVVTPDDTNDKLDITVTGTAGNNVNWVASLRTVETTI